MPRRNFGPFINVHTKPGASSGDRKFFPSTGPIDGSSFKKVRPSFEIYALTSDLVAFPGYQISDDAETWPAATAFSLIGSTSRNSDGTTYDTAFTDISSGLTGGFVRFGFVVRNDTTGTDIQHALMSGRWEFQAN